MKIGIDCRLIGLQNAGIGRYVENLIERIVVSDKDNEYVLFLPEGYAFNAKQDQRIKLVSVNCRHYTLKEQLVLGRQMEAERCDFIHFPNFNIPLFFRGHYVVTIHDLIKHYSRGLNTTTRGKGTYWLKYLAYKIVFARAVKGADKVLVPSNDVKAKVISYYQVPSDKVVVTYEGVDNRFLKIAGPVDPKPILAKYHLKKPYLLYVGSVYPHKNVENLIRAVQLLAKERPDIKLVIACARSVFLERLLATVVQMKASKNVVMAGFVPDSDLLTLYKQAELFVFPTLMEGFGLPGLEAMATGCPVACSDIPVLREIYGNAAVYFDPAKPEAIAEVVDNVLNNPGVRQELSNNAPERVEKFSWVTMVEKTLEVYREVGSRL